VATFTLPNKYVSKELRINMVRLIPPVASFKLKKEKNKPTLIEINWGKHFKHNFVLPTLWMKKLQEKSIRKHFLIPSTKKIEQNEPEKQQETLLSTTSKSALSTTKVSSPKTTLSTSIVSPPTKNIPPSPIVITDTIIIDDNDDDDDEPLPQQLEKLAKSSKVCNTLYVIYICV